MFKQAGDFEGKILEAIVAASKFKPDDPEAFDICLHIQGPEYGGMPQSDWWYGEISNEYGRGNYATKTQREITLANLERIGWEHGLDLSKLDTLVGKTIPFSVVARAGKEKKVYFDVKYIGGSTFGPKRLDPAEAARRIAAMAKSTAAAAPASTDDWL
mgnify:FL=1